MPLRPSAPWHKASYDRFIHQTLPDLLAARVPLSGYRAETGEPYRGRVSLSLAGKDGDIALTFDDVPVPDEDGVFRLDMDAAAHGGYRTVVPVPDQFDLSKAFIRCVGEQLAGYVEARLGEAPGGLPWDRTLAEAWLPISGWIRTFLATEPTSQLLQNTNYLDRWTHLRRISLILLPREGDGGAFASPEAAAAVAKRGLACPITMPEGPNLGWLVEIARGAGIRDNRLVRVDGAGGPDSGFGFPASVIPFIEHSDPSRLLMGANMMRQWIAPRDTGSGPAVGTAQTYDDAIAGLLVDPKGARPEPALVRTGNEIDAPDFWAGHNLLTAFVVWDGDTYEDALVLSESAAARMAFPTPVDIGDKLSNRHGTKGTVSRILPDDAMPRLPDGTAADLICSPFSLVSRLNFGQLREAVMGRIAMAEGKPVTVAPFAAPSSAEIRQRLKRAGLPEDGMETLTVGGKALPHRSTVGIVYWGRLVHLSRSKMSASSTGAGGGQRADDLLLAGLKWRKAHAVISDLFGRSRAEERPLFDRVGTRLRALGIRAERAQDGIAFSFEKAGGTQLACAVPNPWSPDRFLDAVGPGGDPALYRAVAEANDRLSAVVKDGAPQALRARAESRLASAVAAYADSVLSPADLVFDRHVPCSGRAVIESGPEIGIDEIGLPEDMAWEIFADRVAAQVGDGDLRGRTARAGSALRTIASESWLLAYRAGGAFYGAAFRPVLHADPVLRINPRTIALFDGDFDGDIMAVYALRSPEAQAEAAERLSVCGQVRNDPAAFARLNARPQGLIWGLAQLAKTKDGLRRIERCVGMPVGDAARDKNAFDAVLLRVLERESRDEAGIRRTFAVLDALMRLAFDACRASGVSISPFLGEGLDLPEPPAGHDPETHRIYREEVIACLDRCTDDADDDVGTFNTFRWTRARGNNDQYVLYVAAHGPVRGIDGEPVLVGHGYVHGLTPDELIAHSAQSRRGLAQSHLEVAAIETGATGGPPWEHGVLARARRSGKPGVAFARAAARREIDPLTDLDARLLCGLPVT